MAVVAASLNLVVCLFLCYYRSQPGNEDLGSDRVWFAITTASLFGIVSILLVVCPIRLLKIVKDSFGIVLEKDLKQLRIYFI